MTDSNTYMISNIIDKKNYMDFLQKKRDHENITKCQYQLIKKSFESKYHKKNDYPNTKVNLLNHYIQYCLKKQNNTFYLSRLQILLNHYTTFEKSNDIILNMIKNKNVSDSLLSFSLKDKKDYICDEDDNIFIYIHRAYKRLYEKIYKTEYKTDKNIRVLFITYDLQNIDKDHIQQLKKLFTISSKNIDILNQKDINKNKIEDNTYDIVILNADFESYLDLNGLFDKVNHICKENGTFIVLGYDIFTEEDQYIKLCMNKIKNKDIELSYPMNLFELEYMLSKYQFMLFYSNEFLKPYGQLQNYIQTYYSLFINRKL